MGQDNSRAETGSPAQGGAAGAALRQPAAGVAGAAPSAAVLPLAGVEGFQVVRLLPYSPAHKAGLVPFFDIITALDHVLIGSEGRPAMQFFKSYVANHRDEPVCFTVFNLHIRAYRDVHCIPSDEWGGGGLLGCSIEWTRAEPCPERCVHVVDVLEGSPAAHSRELKANRDYIIGMQTAQEPLITLIKDQRDFYSRLEAWHDEQRWTLERNQRFPSEAVEVPHVLLLLVYNSENNTVKEVAVEMGTHPDAALGMSVATGLLHIIPSAATSAEIAAGASLPVMNKFVSVGASLVMPSPAPLETAAPQPPHHTTSSSADYGVHRVVAKVPTEPTAHPHESPVDSHQQTFPPVPPPQQHAEVAAPHHKPPSEPHGAASPPLPPPPLLNPFADEAPSADAVLEGRTALPPPPQLLPSPPQVAQRGSSTGAAVSSTPSPPSGAAPPQVNGTPYPPTASTPRVPTPPPLVQQRLHPSVLPTFSSQRMPPPLHFPVFPHGAAKRTAA
ncbi:Golgi reassembly stacking protein (GRASP) [Novymonas esmeraldas]|uniref:Golgi reassembly stacking protein (GRASP) n=1 Tax=Novymonas esmeraldas TaxID=1808958 RepID=A0AAW0F7N4_9TRYP